MESFGIYTFTLRHGNKTTGIKNSDVMLGEVKLSGKGYEGLSVTEACEKRIQNEIQSKNGTELYTFKDIQNLKCFKVSFNGKSHADSAIRQYIIKFHPDCEEVKYGKKKTEFLRGISREDVYKEIENFSNDSDGAHRVLNFDLRNYQKKLADDSEKTLERFARVLINLSTRGGKSYLSLNLAMRKNPKNILIVTPFVNAEGSFREIVEQHILFEGWKFLTKENVTKDAKYESENNVIFLSWAIFGMPGEGEKEDKFGKEKIQNLLKQVSFDIIIVDETHHTSDSEKAEAKLKAIPHKYEIHLSGSPYNDIFVGRFKKEEIQTLDFIDLIKLDNETHCVGFPKLQIKDICNMKELNEKLVKADPSVFEKEEGFNLEKILLDTRKTSSFMEWIFNNPNPILEKESNHILMFVPRKGACENVENSLRRILPDWSILNMNDKEMSGSQELKVNKFEAFHEKTIVITCAKLTTGVTLKRCDSIFLLRSLSSAETYVQILFRCMTPFTGKAKAFMYNFDSECSLKVWGEVTKIHANQSVPVKSQLEVVREVLGLFDMKTWENDQIEWSADFAEEYLKKIKELPTYYNMKDVFTNFVEPSDDEKLELYSHDFGKTMKEKAVEVAHNKNSTGIKQKAQGAKPKDIKSDIEDGDGEVSVNENWKIQIQKMLQHLDWEIVLNEIKNFDELLKFIPEQLKGNEALENIWKKQIKANSFKLKDFVEEYWITLESSKENPEKELEFINKMSRFEDSDFRTPMKLVAEMYEKTSVTKDSCIFDPCVGTGNILWYAHYKLGVPKSHLFGMDINPVFINLLKKLGYENVWVGDATNIENLKKPVEMVDDSIFQSMKVVMNPPFGKQGTTCIPIIKNIQSLYKDIGVIAPQNIFFKGDIAKFADYFEVKENTFDEAEICELSLVHLTDKEINKYDKESVALKGSDLELARALRKYNETHKRTWEKLTGWNRYDPKKLMSVAAKNSFGGVVSDGVCEDVWKQGRLFQATTWTPLDGVHQDKNTWDYKCNYDNIFPFGMGARPKTDHILDAFVFETKAERDNFMKWWYSCCEGEYNSKSLTNRILHLIEKGVSRSAGAQAYITYFPYLDWSHSWTDKEILKELGLSESEAQDFLESTK